MEFNSNTTEIIFEKFDCLDKEEILVAKKIVEKYLQKIKKIATIKQIKLEMKAHSKIKVKNFEVRGRAEYIDGVALSSQQNINPFVAIDLVMEKIHEEIKHKIDRK